MPVLVTSNFDDDLIKNEQASMEHFFIISLWEIFRHSRAANSVVSGLIWLKFRCMSSLPASIKGSDQSNREKVETPFSPF